MRTKHNPFALWHWSEGQQSHYYNHATWFPSGARNEYEATPLERAAMRLRIALKSYAFACGPDRRSYGVTKKTADMYETMTREHVAQESARYHYESQFAAFVG